MQIALLRRRARRREGARAEPLEPPGELTRALAGRLAAVRAHRRPALARWPRSTTSSTRDRPMQRLLMGEVGSGKTVVALYAMLRAVESGAQAALMAPTETLAEQHFATLQALMPGELVQAALLTGSTPGARRTDLLGKLATGELKLLVGTHALIEEAVEFDRLGVAVVDEQHRFGVNQRRALDRKAPEGVAPHILHMTATPIPRTLALTAYGDLDVTVLRELPGGPAADRDLRRLAPSASARGPTTGSARSSTPAARRSSSARWSRSPRRCRPAPPPRSTSGCKAGELKDYRVVLLHGQLKSREKAEAMKAFAAGGADVLVATTVIEVGIDVPNATVMLVENAERYGISQLHQLRGRIGRGRARLAVPAVRAQGVRCGCARWPSTATGSSSPRSTSSCAARGRCSARASPGWRSSGSRGCPRTPSCSSAPGCAPGRSSTPTRTSPRPSTRCSTRPSGLSYGAEAMEPIPACSCGRRWWSSAGGSGVLKRQARVREGVAFPEAQRCWAYRVRIASGCAQYAATSRGRALPYPPCR